MTEQSRRFSLKNSVPTVKKWLVLPLFGLFLLMLLIDFLVGFAVRERVYHDPNALPYHDYAVVLGTAKYYPSGGENLYYKYRLEAAKTLLDQQKVRYLLLSGDNSTPYYNEPRTMTNDLKKAGVPAEKLQQDFAGLSTEASVVRAAKTFQLPSFTIISQQFHCERALLLAQFHQIDAVCFVAKYPDWHIRVRLREIFARSAMLVEFLFDLRPVNLQPVKEAKQPG